VALYKENEGAFMGDTSWIIKSRKKMELSDKTKPDSYRVWESIVSDSGSSRTLWTKTFYKDGISFSLVTESDTLAKPSAFVKNFYDSFLPSDMLKGINPFTKKSTLFFSDLLSNDSIKHKLAFNHIDDIELDSSDLPLLIKAINALDWKEKKYLDTKNSLVGKMGEIKTNAASDHLKEIYYAAGDTAELQYAALESLLQQQTAYSFNVFRSIINSEPPVLDGEAFKYSSGYSYKSLFGKRKFNYKNGNFMDELHDSLLLTKTILPDLLPLLNLDDYKSSVMKLLGEMIDSNLVQPKDYEIYFSRFLLEAKQELKKQAIVEKKKAIEKAEEEKKDYKDASGLDDNEKDYGNDDLGLYATLLLPYMETNTNVQSLIRQMLQSKDKKLKYSITMLLVRKGKPYEDSLLNYFASLDEYRFDLYKDLKKINMLEKFPSFYNNHLDLGRSALIDKRSSGKPDSLVYIDRLNAEIKGYKGYIYFYKYKSKKDDLSWKLALAGIVPEDPQKFEFEKKKKGINSPGGFSASDSYRNSPYNFTRFTDTRISSDEQLQDQLKNELKKLLFSSHNSAKEFYENDSDDDYDFSQRFGFGN
ncbi:MAG: hypothetical protein ABUT20_21775, partial [Bacteroidota bacterium]